MRRKSRATESSQDLWEGETGAEQEDGSVRRRPKEGQAKGGEHEATLKGWATLKSCSWAPSRTEGAHSPPFQCTCETHCCWSRLGRAAAYHSLLMWVPAHAVKILCIAKCPSFSIQRAGHRITLLFFRATKEFAHKMTAFKTPSMVVEPLFTSLISICSDNSF